MFGCQMSLSDHTMGVGVAMASVALGSTVIENATLSRAEGVWIVLSLEPPELAALVKERVPEAGRPWVRSAMDPLKLNSRVCSFGVRSMCLQILLLVIVSLLKTSISFDQGLGLPPSQLDMVLGRRLKQSVVAWNPCYLGYLILIMTALKKVIGFDSWTGGAVNFKRIANELTQRGCDFSVIAHQLLERKASVPTIEYVNGVEYRDISFCTHRLEAVLSK